MSNVSTTPIPSPNSTPTPRPNALSSFILVAIRLIRLSFLFLFFPPCYHWNRFFSKGDLDFRKRSIKCTTFFAKYAAKVLNLDIQTENLNRLINLQENYLLVSNHLSYLDIVVISTQYSSAFVTSVEMENTPVLGAFCKAGGSFFVERRDKFKLRKEIDSISGALRQGLPVLIFPEGTSSNGVKMLPFRHALFKTAMKAQRGIIPLCIRYTSIDGAPIDQSNRDDIYWFGDMTFAPHFFKLLTIKKIQVHLSVLEPISYEEECHRKHLSHFVHDAIEEKYTSFMGSESAKF